MATLGMRRSRSMAPSLTLTDVSTGGPVSGDYIPVDNQLGNGNAAQQNLPVVNPSNGELESVAVLGPVPNDGLDRGLQNTVSPTSNGVVEATLSIVYPSAEPVTGTLSLTDATNDVTIWWLESGRWVPASSLTLADISPGTYQVLIQGTTAGADDIQISYTPNTQRTGTTPAAINDNEPVKVFGVTVSIAGPTVAVGDVMATQITADDGYNLGLTDSNGNPIADDDPSVTQIPPNNNDPYLETVTITFSSTVPVGSPYNASCPAGYCFVDPITGKEASQLSGFVPASHQETEELQAGDGALSSAPGSGPLSAFNILLSVSAIGAQPAAKPAQDADPVAPVAQLNVPKVVVSQTVQLVNPVAVHSRRSRERVCDRFTAWEHKAGPVW